MILPWVDTSANEVIIVNPLPIPTITLTGTDLTTSTYSSYQWLYNGSELMGETNQAHTPLANGNYQVIVWDSNGCPDTSAVFVMDNVGLSELFTTNIRIYPNPVMDKLHIQTSLDVKTIFIKNMLGQEVYMGKYSSVIDISTLQNGMYIIELFDNSNVVIYQTKVLINK